MIKHLLDCGAILINLGRKQPEAILDYPQTGKHYNVDFYDTDKLTTTLNNIVDGLKHVDVLINNSFDFGFIPKLIKIYN